MSSTFGNVLHLSIFGQSHSPAIGCSLDGIPAGIAVDQEQLQAFLDRRAPGRDETATKRREADAAHIIAGVIDGHTTGAPIAAIIENTNTRSKDYSELRRKPRPGHADFPARVKYHNMHDVAGGGHFSGRLTAPLCIAGGIALQALEARGIQVMAHVAQIGGISDLPMDDMVYREADRKAILTNDLPCIDATAAGRMREEILAARDELDSIGGIVECGIYGLPAGIGDPMFDGIENRIAQIAFGIPAVKGVEFGMGFAVAAMRGSENRQHVRPCFVRRVSVCCDTIRPDDHGIDFLPLHQRCRHAFLTAVSHPAHQDQRDTTQHSQRQHSKMPGKARFLR